MKKLEHVDRHSQRSGKSLRKPRAAAPYSGAALLAFPLALACLRGRISFFLRDRKSSIPVQRTITPTPAAANPRSGAAVVPAYPLRSKPARTSAAENGYRLERTPPLKNSMLYPRKNARMEPPRYAPRIYPKIRIRGIQTRLVVKAAATICVLP